MTNRFARSLRVLLPGLLALAIGVTAGCSKKPKPSTDVVKAETPAPAPAPVAPVEPVPPAETTELVLEDIFFDYDKHNLRDDARTTMERNARLLTNNSGVKVLLEGHCDERGTVEYNLALGDRRAQSAKNYLVQFGVEAGRISTISYGEERPFSQGHDEGAWSENRRVHFVIQK